MSTETEFYYANGNLHYQRSVTTDSKGDKSTTDLYFFYDSNGYLSGIDYNGTTYYPATNRRGDVVAIYKNTGECVAKYEYDAWGNVLSVTDGNNVEITDQSHIAHINPIRYRGYYYDVETTLYYLQSRYYNPEVGRFLNADGFITTDIDEPLTYNMFAYCMNNPVMYSDPTGCSTDEYSTFFDFIFNVFDVVIDSLIHLIENSSAPSNVGAGTYAKHIAAQVSSLEKMSSVVSIIGDVVAYGLVGIETLSNVIENYKNNASNEKIIWDATIDMFWGCSSVFLSAQFGAMIGTAIPIPVVGTVIGAACGIGIGLLIDWGSEEPKKYWKGLVKSEKKRV